MKPDEHSGASGAAQDEGPVVDTIAPVAGCHTTAAPQAAVPEGFALVPVEPTAEMIAAWRKNEGKTFSVRYAAALAAAPQPPAMQAAGVELSEARRATDGEDDAIKPEDLIIETYAPSPRPQWIYYQDRGIRIIHKPTGLSAESHEDQSQYRNKAAAMDKLRTKVAAAALAATPSEAKPHPQAVGRLMVCKDESAEDGYSYDIATNSDGHERLRALDGATLYVGRAPSEAAPAWHVPGDWLKFVRDCAATSGLMVNGNNLSTLAFRLLAATQPAKEGGETS